MTSGLSVHECPESTVGRSVTLQFERFARPAGVYPEQPRTRETPAGERRFRASPRLHATRASRLDVASEFLSLGPRPPSAHCRRLRRGR